MTFTRFKKNKLSFSKAKNYMKDSSDWLFGRLSFQEVEGEFSNYWK